MSIDAFKSNFTSGVRPNLYEVIIDNLPEKLKFMCKTTALPGKTINPIEVMYKNKIIPVRGDVTFDDWTTSIMLDEDFAIRTELEEWMERIQNNNEVTGASNTSDYFGTATVRQLGTNDQVIAEYKFYNLWPTSITQVDLSFETRDTIAQFDVTWKYSHWERV